MPDLIDATGLQVKTFSEIRSELESGLREIYGADINLDQNSPDGQMVGIVAQVATDLRELLVQVNNSFDPDRALGRLLDERVVINNIERIGGTYTIQPITIVVDRTVALQGLDADFNDPQGTGYTVQDNSGNRFILVDSETLTAGTYSRNFRAQEIGLVETIVDTIQTPVTIILGVVSVNNPSAALEVGQRQETDSQLRVRRERSVALASNGYLNGLLGDILAIDGVTAAKLYENYTDTTDSLGVPEHSTWLIVEGGANSDIANVYYENKSYGSGMKGAVTVDIATPSGGIFTALFDRPTAADLYIRFNLKKTIPLFIFDIATIANYIADNLTYEIGDFAETSLVTAAAMAGIAAQGGGGVPLDVEISDDGVVWTDYLDAPDPKTKWTLDVSRITITVV